MMMTTTQSIIMIAAIAIGTLLTRASAFLLFPASKPTPKYVRYLGKVLPYAITAMLIVYCLKETTPLAWPHGLPEGIAVLAVAALFLIFKNSLLAIAAGTILYMILVQLVFV